MESSPATCANRITRRSAGGPPADASAVTFGDNFLFDSGLSPDSALSYN
jgi:hypothetical protein